MKLKCARDILWVSNEYLVNQCASWVNVIVGEFEWPLIQRFHEKCHLVK